jgi:uncharacterized protein YgiB involved in biofilm formation
MAGTTVSQWLDPDVGSFHHFMVEVRMLDDVGQGYDLAQLDDKLVAYTLGRHTNDHMTSFYVHSPSGFLSNMVGEEGSSTQQHGSRTKPSMGLHCGATTAPTWSLNSGRNSAICDCGLRPKVSGKNWP